jgi:hypothetical protein
VATATGGTRVDAHVEGEESRAKRRLRRRKELEPGRSLCWEAAHADAGEDLVATVTRGA